MIEGIRCLVQERIHLFSMPLIERIALIVIPPLFCLSTLSLFDAYPNDVTYVVSLLLLPIGLTLFIMNIVLQAELWLKSSFRVERFCKIDLKESVMEVFKRAVLLKKDITNFREFSVIYLFFGLAGLATVFCVYSERNSRQSFKWITISSLAMIILGMSSLYSLKYIPCINKIQNNLGECLTTSLGEGDVCKWG